MAAQVPAKDVLCEAMEYLSKLGANLRTRSENLKDKRIRREKLNNVLAVQKAASKVLLICELSKKSLENVETGVRKVLELIDTSQAASSDGGKKSQAKNDVSTERKYYYFEYKSRKLRIKNRISFKHYNSVRVHAKMLPKYMIDKYPVYYDCELYRIRKKQKELQELKEGSKKENISENSIQNDASVISIPDTPISGRETGERINMRNQVNDESIISIPDSPEPQSDDTKIDKGQRSSSADSNKDRSNRDVNQSPRKKSHNSEKHQSRQKLGEKRSSDKSEEQNKKLSKRKRIISDSSSDDDKNTDIDKEEKQIAVETHDEENKSYHVPKKQKLDDKDEAKLSEKEDTAKNDNGENDNTGNEEAVKPVIKCVSLSKLLKPDVLKKKKIVGPHSKPKDTTRKPEDQMTKAKEKEEVRRLKMSQEQARKEKEEEEYWSQRRKEVSSFQSKLFVINVTRLPELSIAYLNQLGLKKVTQGGFTICEITDEHSNEKGLRQEDENGDNTSKSKIITKRTSDESKSNSRQALSNSCNEPNNAMVAEANKVKHSLLYESDSDEMFGSDNELKLSKKDTENIKNALLDDSDSETKKSDDESRLDNQDKVSSEKHTEEEKKADKDSASGIEKAKNDTQKSESLTDKNERTSPIEEPKSPTVEKEINKDDAPSNLSDVDTGSLQMTFDVESDSEQKKANDESGPAAAKKSSDKSHDSEKDCENNDKNTIENDSHGSVRKSDEIISEHKKNEKTPEKEDTDKAKLSLLTDSSGDKSKTPLNQRLTPQSKKKRMRESIQAKKMLMIQSSSDTEDEQLKEALKEIKDSLLQGSDEENKKRMHLKESSPSSGEDIIKKVKKKIRPTKEKRHKHKHKKRQVDSEDSSHNSDNSKSSSSKMVRSKSKPGNSSSQNSDTADYNDKDIDGLTNLNTLNMLRRRNSNSSEMSESSTTFEGKSKKKSNKAKIKATGLIAEDMLKAESSSESTEASAEEIDDDEDMPSVTLPSINGSGSHLVKEDLLGESDSSVSHKDEKSSKEESDTDDKPNTKRRKAIAISSDSEVGSSRKKDKDTDFRSSDFEDSDDSDIKRTKRKKKATDSDASGDLSSNEGGKKKRRRIKSVKDSDASGSESETEGRNKHGRKNIRKVMGKNQLEEATKKAAREEKERIARIAERQKMYNNMEFDESGKPDEVVLDKVVLDFDPETKEPLIEVDRGLVKKLKPHQANGIKFMWNACFESVKRIKKDKGSGCILAHCMGLGKTLQVVSLTHTLLIHSDLTTVNRVLVVCPLSTVLNWVNEFNMWLKYAKSDYEVDVYELSRYKQNSERAFQLSQWFRHGGVCVLGYEMFRNLSADNSKKFKKKMLKNFQEALVDPGPDLVVCDEGHLLKNEKTSLSQSMNRVKTLRRIVLTGTPLQNNLKEYYCMVQFVKPNLLGKYNEYLNRFVNPITNGQYTDSTEHDIKIMKRRSHVLHKMLDGSVQRRDYGVLAPFLPPKHEYVLFITLSDVQIKLYQHYLDNFSRRPLPGKSSGFLFPDFQSLQRIWTHPLVLKYNSDRYEIMQQKKRDKEEEDSEGSLRDFIDDDDSTPDESSTEESTDDSSDDSNDSRKKKKKAKKSKGKDKDKDGKGEGGQSRPRRGTRANPVEHDEEENIMELPDLKNENPTEWWIKLVTDDELEDMRNSHKLVLLFDILRQCEAIGDKLLVFSQSLYSLDLIEHFLGKVDDATQEGRIDEKLGGHIGTWSPGLDYFRLDGSTSCENRSIWCKNFNKEDNPRARLFLISTRAGGLGINLVAANRVVIFDVSWNPSHDVQSIFRVYRFGQKKPCYVYRFLAMGTMEEKIYERQVTKQAISKRVIDEQQIDRHYAENDLAELYKFEPQPPSPRPLPPLPKDRLFAEMLREHEAQIYKYHEHDSLLENKEEETLSEEERKAAWEDFENEKNRPPPAPFPNTWQMPNFLQQQQLAYTALAAMLRKDMPNISENQLRDMLPIIYNSNPQMFGGYDYGLMQKLSEIYKYTPGMMNPAMMSPVMNPASGLPGVGGMGGASGLQYEPPWLRQQQQQNMRLQQLLQHQNQQMGAKFYAGGLGSRDPVAMALQQQRAREIMLGGPAGGPAAGRPRGRPPMQPRAPPTGDVVNLDSD